MEPAAHEATVVCVLGMSRTGTSLTTQLLSLAGVYLGPEEDLLGADLHQLAGEGEDVLARAREANPRGFWEHYRLMRLNERILRILGGSWRDPPRPAPGWERSPELEDERAEARSLLAESFDGRPLWGWKDPRNSLTLPFWQQLLPNMRFVICLRNPVDVAASLRRRDGISPEQGFRLWLVYLASALVNTAGRPRMLVPYESHFNGAVGLAARMADFVGRADALERVEDHGGLDGVADERLWRNRTSLEDLVRDGQVPDDAISLHLLTETLASTLLPAANGSPKPALDDAVDLYAARLLGGERGPTA
jgi:hypothetical protein